MPNLKEEHLFQCEHCSRSFSRKHRLKMHTMNVHFKVKPCFKCALCHKSFSEKGNLSVHSRIHTGEKPFVCPVCHKSFRTYGNFCDHQRRHSQIKYVYSYLSYHILIQAICMPALSKDILPEISLN